MIGIYMGGVRVINMNFSPCFKYIGAPVNDATVTIKQCSSLAQLYIPCDDGELCTVIHRLEDEVAGVVEDMYFFCGVLHCHAGGFLGMDNTIAQEQQEEK